MIEAFVYEDVLKEDVDYAIDPPIHLTPRDFIAIAAMQGDLANRSGIHANQNKDSLACQRYYEIADCMLEARRVRG